MVLGSESRALLLELSTVLMVFFRMLSNELKLDRRRSVDVTVDGVVGRHDR